MAQAQRLSLTVAQVQPCRHHTLDSLTRVGWVACHTWKEKVGGGGNMTLFHVYLPCLRVRVFFLFQQLHTPLTDMPTLARALATGDQRDQVRMPLWLCCAR